MSVQVFSPGELNTKLEELSKSLSSVSAALPLTSNHYNFLVFGLLEDDIEIYGEPGAVNHALEVTFAPEGRQNGIELKERGPGLEAVVDVLREYCTKFEKDAMLQKWVWDLIDAAIRAGGSIDAEQREDTHRNETGDVTSGVGVVTSEVDTQCSGTGTKRKKSSRDGNNKFKKPTLSSPRVIDQYIDIDPSEFGPKKGGPKAHPLVGEIAIPCYLKLDAKRVLHRRCAGAINGCETKWVDAANHRSRFFKHCSRCTFLSSELRQKVNDVLASESLGKAISDDRVEQESVSSLSVSHTSSSVDFRSQSISLSKQKTISEWTANAGRDELNKNVDLAILKLICVRGLPPTLVDSQEWKNLLAITAPKYQPTGSKTFVDIHIPREYSFIKNQQLGHLKKCQNLTISFDGQTTKGLQSVYTIHIITPERRVFFYEGNECSKESHTGKFIFKLLDSALQSIGPKLFRGITSDNTGNTSVARRMIRDAYPWIIILPDPCHRLNLLCNDIAKLEYFKETIKDVQRTIKFFRKSSGATAALKSARSAHGIKCGIRAIGKTRFGTVYTAALSIEKNYPAISQLVKNEEITIPDVNNLFSNTFRASNFLHALQQITTILAPISKSITCLESTHSTVSDVYLFWLAISAEIYRMISEDGLANPIKEAIRRAVNRRFNQMINDAPSDVYLTGFVLDPSSRNSYIFHDLNHPTAIQKLKIPPRNKDGQRETSIKDEVPAALRRTSVFLFGMLRCYYKNDQLNQPFPGLSFRDATLALREQIIKYQKGIYPFDRPFVEKTDTAGIWWAKLDEDRSNDPQPLAKLARSIFELLPNSMADERTASTFTWLNSPLRNRQEVDTLVRITTIRQWYQNRPESETKPFRPTVRFRDMKETLFPQKTNQSNPAHTNVTRPHSSNPVDDLNSKLTDEDDDLGTDEGDINLDDIDSNENGTYDDSAATETFSSRKFDVEDDVDLSAPILHDILSDVDNKPRKPTFNTDEKVGENQTIVIEDENFDIDDEDLWSI